MENERNLSEMLGQVVDIYEDYLDENGMEILNSNRDEEIKEAVANGEYANEEEAREDLGFAHIYGEDYDRIVDVFRNRTELYEGTMIPPLANEISAGIAGEMVDEFIALMSELGVYQDPKTGVRTDLTDPGKDRDTLLKATLGVFSAWGIYDPDGTQEVSEIESGKENNGVRERGRLWKLSITYSWGDEEEPRYFRKWENAKNEMMRLASGELICAGMDHEYQVHMVIPEDIGIEKDKRSSVEIQYDYDNEICYYVIEQEDVYAIAEDEKEEKLEVETSAGIIRAYESTSPEQPGIYVMLQPKGSEDEIDVSYVSVYEDPAIATPAGERPEDVVILTYGDVYQEDYTDKTILRREDVVEAVSIGADEA